MALGYLPLHPSLFSLGSVPLISTCLGYFLVSFGGGVRRKGASRPGRGGAPPPQPAGNVRAAAELTASPRLEKAPGSQWRQNPKRQAKGEKTARPNVDDPPLNPKVKSRKTHSPHPRKKVENQILQCPLPPSAEQILEPKKRGGAGRRERYLNWSPGRPLVGRAPVGRCSPRTLKSPLKSVAL